MFLKRKKSIIIKSFVSQLMWKILCWVIFGFSLAFLGGLLGNENYISQDILGNAWEKMTGKRIDFHCFFLGENLIDSQKLLKYALIFLGITVFLEVVITFINIVLRLRDKYIENNNFYLYNRLIFILNSLLRANSYIILVLSFVSAQTFIFSLISTLCYSFLHKKKIADIPKTENFFVWQDPHVRRIFFASGIIIFFIPFIHQKIETFLANIETQSEKGGSFSKLQELVKNLMNSIPFLQPLWQLISNISRFAHWITLFVFLRALILSRIKEFSEFWDGVNKIGQQAADFKHFYYYQKMLSEAKISKNGKDISIETKKIIMLGDYGFLKIVPNFLKNETLVKGLMDNNHQENLEIFTNKIQKIIEFIDFIQIHLNPSKKDNYQQKKVKFIIFCSFNEYRKFEELKKTEQLILLE